MAQPAAVPVWRRRRTWIIVGAIVAVLVIIVVLVVVRVQDRRAASSEITSTVERGTVTASVTASGQLVDQYTYTVAPGVSAVLTQRDGVAVSGSSGAATGTGASTGIGAGTGGGANSPGYKTTTINVGVGDKVTANETIASATNVSARSADLTDAATSAQSALNTAYASLSDDQASYSSEESSPTATTQSLNAIKKQISADYTAIDNAKSALNAANENIAAQSVSVTSPVDGYILSITTAVNASASQVATIGAGDREISVMVSEYDISQVKLNQHVTLTLGSSTTQFSGTVEAISPQPTDASGVEDYQVVISSTSIPTTGRVGMTVTASIAIASHQHVLNVPATAITTTNGHTYVTVVDGKGKQVKTRVTVGLVGNSSVEILSGLKAGQTVVSGAAGTVPKTTTGLGSRL